MSDLAPYLQAQKSCEQVSSILVTALTSGILVEKRLHPPDWLELTDLDHFSLSPINLISKKTFPQIGCCLEKVIFNSQIVELKLWSHHQQDMKKVGMLRVISVISGS